MSLRSSSERYGTIGVLIHWVTAALILIALLAGLSAANSPDTATKAQILRVHIPAAVCVFLLTLFRVAWWLGFDSKPAPLAGMPRWQARGAQAVHLLFYIVIFGMFASGAGMLLLSGAGPVVFGQPGTLSDFWQYRPRVPHGLEARLLLVLLVFHIGAALYHHFLRRDGLLSRMWFAR